ncbi:hypothetical protein OPT61_g3316 [Boeremia exigua]|uniref:Uncharacterized protein n=1 Tax=Boeremia exigua TaxID=749465 RepID=A0ACC2IIJ6_9PLEO|nr:hypothetical protein OPT61_g3316 [Boeremia exigua]
MTTPAAIIEATEKGMMGENLCAGGAALQMPDSAAQAGEVPKPQVLSRAEQAGPEKAVQGEGHVRIKGVDV